MTSVSTEVARLLRRVGHVLQRTRPADECFRPGGDEFAVVLLATPLEGARVVARRLMRQIAA
jgi:PleD family two-component response regulator